ncbi:MAG: phospholipid/cholesterol/gamma-HCH transport system substrate-binding protein [Pyrinomonadaceae bacterium]|jgi:phospholipid/cholesterol/gamma-HCH transport system substrate-binding protein|nr:phospholipid/cholesterol/gamma-HCH transport system substrate-binding protein [Pyrinomonadaceae bacterium]
MPRSTKTVNLNQLRVGIFVLVSVVILIFLILNASGDINPFKKKLHLKARFADANGLRKGSEVRLSGVRVGKVDDINLLPPNNEPTGPRVEAVMTLEATIDGRAATERIRKDSTATQGSPSLLGNEMLINISPGTALAPPVVDYDTLRSSSANTVNDFATSGTDLAQRLSKLSDQMSLIVKDVQEGKGTVGRLFSDEALYNNLNATVRETEDVMRQIRSGNGSAGRFVNDPALYNNANEIAMQLRRISEDLRAGRGTAGKLLTNDELYNRINRTADRLDRSVEQINSMIADLNAGHGTLGKLIKDEQMYNDARSAIARFNTTAERIDNIVSSAQRGEGTVGKLLTDEALYSNVNQLSSEGVKLIYDFRQNPKKYLTIKFQLF